MELSGELRARQEQRLKDFPQVEWLTEIPSSFTGIVLGNEVLDAMPVELVIKSGDGMAFAWCRHRSSQSFHIGSDGVEVSEEMLAQIPEAEALPVGYIPNSSDCDWFHAQCPDMLWRANAQAIKTVYVCG